MDHFTSFMQGKGWILQVFLIIFFTLLFNFFLSRGIERFIPKMKKKDRIWDKAFIESIHLPLRVFVWLVGISFAGKIVGMQAEHDLFFKSIPTIRSVGIVIITIWFLLRFITNIENAAIKRQKKVDQKFDKTTIRAICQLLRVAAIITGVLVGLQTIGVSISAVLAFGGAGGLVIGFAAKDLLANFFGGLMLFLDRPFTVGEWIRSPDRDIEGTVEHIGWRLTRIRTFDKRPLYVPNGIFSTISIQNPARMTNRRIKATVGIRYEDAPKADQILLDIEKMLREHPEIDQNLVTYVKLIEFGESSLNFRVYTFTKTKEWVKFQGIQHDVFLKIIEIITKHGAECSSPTLTLSIPEGISVRS
ncbi:MAG: mechanosensitive ion channel family protein [Simkaniaceae bacterium]|nr:mechanosensitive ion channel family protein [Simkaniaceae bacterium]